MELTLESALSPGGLLGHLSYLLLILSMLATNMVMLRLIVIASAVPAIAFDLIWLSNPVGVFWEALLVLVNLVQLGRILGADLRARFREEEMPLVGDLAPVLSRGEVRRLLDAGVWIELPAGATLTTEGMRPEALHYVSEGEVDVLRLGARVGRCGPGNFVGEMALLTADGSASARAETRDRVRAWRLATPAYERLERDSPKAFAALQAAIARDMRGKIVQQNASRAGF
jgi:hypothetical protein